jgi:hypothetical protein
MYTSKYTPDANLSIKLVIDEAAKKALRYASIEREITKKPGKTCDSNCHYTDWARGTDRESAGLAPPRRCTNRKLVECG